MKEPTVGKSATFVKVDHVIQETKNLMNIISKVVSTCFDCANKVSNHSWLFLHYFPHCYHFPENSHGVLSDANILKYSKLFEIFKINGLIKFENATLKKYYTLVFFVTSIPH